MQKGNKANVTIIRGDEEIKGTVVANPKMQRFDFADANGQTLFVKQVEKQKVAQTQTQGQSQQQNEGKNETVNQVNQQNAGPVESKGQVAQQDNQTAQKDSQKATVAEEQKNDTTQRKKTGVKI
jgi:hypothetical protein